MVTNYTVHPFQQLVEACNERAAAAGQALLSIATPYTVGTNDASVTITNQWGPITIGTTSFYAHVRSSDITALVNKMEAITPYYLDYTNHAPWFAQWLEPSITNQPGSVNEVLPRLSKARLIDLIGTGYTTNRTAFADNWNPGEFSNTLAFVDGGDASWQTTSEARNDYAIYYAAYFTNAIYATGFGATNANGVYLGIRPADTNIAGLAAYNMRGYWLEHDVSAGFYGIGPQTNPDPYLQYFRTNGYLGAWTALLGPGPAGITTNGPVWGGVALSDWRLRYYAEIPPVVRYSTTGAVQAVDVVISGLELVASNQSTVATSETVSVSASNTPCTITWYAVTNLAITGASPLQGDQVEIIYTNEVTFYHTGPFLAMTVFFDSLYSAVNRMTRTYKTAGVYTNDTIRYRWGSFTPSNTWGEALLGVSNDVSPSVLAGGNAQQQTLGRKTVSGSTTSFLANAYAETGRKQITGLWTNKAADIDLWIYFLVRGNDDTYPVDPGEYPLGTGTTFDQQDSSYTFAQYNLVDSGTKSAGTNIWTSSAYGITNQPLNWTAEPTTPLLYYYTGYEEYEGGFSIGIVDWSPYFDYIQ
jgi:hypothetical protein